MFYRPNLKTFLLTLMMTLTMGMQAQMENRVFMVYDASNGLADNSAQILKVTRTGRIVAVTHGHLNFFDGHSFNSIDPSATSVYSLSGYAGEYRMYFDRFHHLWIKRMGRLTCVDLTREQFCPRVDSVLNVMGVEGKIDNLMADDESNIYFLQQRTLKSPALKKSFEMRTTSPLEHIDIYRDSLFLTFHRNGSVAIYDYKTCRFLYRDASMTPEEAVGYDNGNELCRIGNTFYYVCMGVHQAVLMSYDVERRLWRRELQMPIRMNDLCPRDSLLYIGTEQGYLVYNTQSRDLRHIQQLTLTKGRVMEDNVHALCFDLQGGLWLGTEKRGLLYGKGYPIPLKSYLNDAPVVQPFLRLMDQQPVPVVKDRLVNCELTDSRGWLWRGTFTGLVVHRPNQAPQTIRMKDGLSNEVIHALVEDRDHDIWCSTSFGIAHVYVREGSIYHVESYINQDNVPNEAFLDRRAVMLPDGRIVMQSIDHVLVFNPAEFQGSKFGDIPHYPKMIRLLVNGNVIEPGVKVDGEEILDRAVSRVRELNVSYTHNSLVMTFSGLNYLRPVQTYYRVRIKGIPAFNDWRILSYTTSSGLVDRYGILRLPLSGLTPGTYVIEMQVSMWPDKWVAEPHTWVINVLEPWWRTTGLYVLLAVLLAALFLTNFLFYNRNMRLRMLHANKEADLLSRVRNFAMRCLDMENDILAPLTDAMKEQGAEQVMSPEFVEVMMKIVPAFQTRKTQRITMIQLAELTGMEPEKLYVLLAGYLDRNPRLLVGRLRLQKAANLLLTTDMTVEEVAETCRFESPNRMISAFYHTYHVFPKDYRSSRAE